MGKEVIVLFLIGILLISPLVLAQEQAQTYSGFNRFVDNVKMFFSSGDGKVKLALEIREKEVISAIENDNNGEEKDMNKNLANAWKKLQIVQEKVSMNTAEQVKENSNQIQERIMDKENLSNEFKVYNLEEEKTGLTAEWVIEYEGKEGQALTREVVNTVGGENKGNRTGEIEERIGEIDNEISNWVVKTSVGKDGEGDNGLTWEVKTEVANGDNGLKQEVKNYVEKNNVVDSSLMTKDNQDASPAQNNIEGDICEGENCILDDVAPGPDGLVGYQGDSDYDADGNKRDDGLDLEVKTSSEDNEENTSED